MTKVLIIDDEEIIRRTIRKLGRWEEFGMEVAGEAENGLLGLQMIEQQTPDVVFLDMRMPGLTGAQLIQALLEKQIRVKLVVISGFDSFQYAQMAIRYGAIDYLLKPIEREEFNGLLHRISRAIALERGTEEASSPEKPDTLLTQGDTLAAIRRRIEQDCTQSLSLESLASEFYLNKEYLSRAFKKRYGTGITSLIHTKRLVLAKTLLQQGFKIRDVAERTGYEDVNYFGRVFRKYERLSPSEYAEAYKRK